MFFIKKIILSMVLIGFYSYQSSAMQFVLNESIRNFPMGKVWYQVSKRSFHDNVNKNISDTEIDLSREKLNKKLEIPIIRKNIPNSYILPTDFFMEKRDNVILESVNERVIHVHRNITMEKEMSIQDKNNQQKYSKYKQFALFKDKDGFPIDRRIKVNDPLSPQYLPICYLHCSYRLSDKDSLLYTGSGFRNSINQIITAGHNLSVEEEDLEKFCERKKILLPSKKFSFNKNLLTVQIIFGYRDEKGTPQYSYISEVNGKHTFIHDSRDLGIVQLPAIQKKLLDDNIGSLPITFFPDQPHEYVDKDITIVGYPGEIEQPSLHAHNGPIKNVDPGKIVFYDVDTTKGNSGSPGLNGIIKDESNIIPVFLTHTHSVTENKINAGQGYDQDFYDFMINKLLE